MKRGLLLLMLATLCGCGVTARDMVQSVILPEQRTIENYLDPDQLPPTRIPANVPPRTVTDTRPETVDWPLTLEETIRISLQNTRVVRVLTGATVVASGQTIYDAAINNAIIDQQQANFDPVLKQNNQFSFTNTPLAEQNFNLSGLLPGVGGGPVSILGNPPTILASTPTNAFQSTLGVSQNNLLGGQWAVNFLENPQMFAGQATAINPLFPNLGYPLNPQQTSSLAISYTQPLLQGAGFRVNRAPIVIARINTEVSFFQYKDSVQEMVRGVAEAYWNLVQARTVAWARRIQVQQSEEQFLREQARLKSGLADLKDVAQARVTYTTFKANLVAADAAVLASEGTLRNLIGLPPNDNRRIVPVSAPTSARLRPDWDELLRLAERRRPDIIELKLIIEAERQRLILARNQALPQLNAVYQYQWNGLSGTMPNGAVLSTAPGQFVDWTAAINFSVPLTLRYGRAQVRQEKLLIERDLANLQQGMHAAIHELAISVRNLDSAYEQYLAFKEARAAADTNVRVQNEKFRAGQSIYLNVLQALNDWGNAVTSEAGALLSYNTALATVERQTGTILETHGLFFVEERFRAAGPLGLPRDYPMAQPPMGTPQLEFEGGDGQPAENFFDLRNPAPRPTK